MRELLKLHWRSILWTLCIVVCIGWVSIIANPICQDYPSDFLADRIGGIFAFLMGLITLGGVTLALIQIREQKSIITSYPQLLENLKELIENTDASDAIKIVSFFVVPGYFQIQNKEKAEDLLKFIKKAGVDKKIKPICLNSKDHLSMMIELGEKRTPQHTTPNDIIKYQADCEGIITESKGVKLPYKFLPHYYFFVNDKKAIIVTPVGLPSMNEEIYNDVIQEGKYESIMFNKQDNYIKNRLDNARNDANNKEINIAKVTTFGFETSDKRIIEQLKDEYDKYYKLAIRLNETGT